MEKDDKGSTMIRMGVSGWMFLLVPAYPGCPGSKAVKRSLLPLSNFEKNSRTFQDPRERSQDFDVTRQCLKIKMNSSFLFCIYNVIVPWSGLHKRNCLVGSWAPTLCTFIYIFSRQWRKQCCVILFWTTSSRTLSFNFQDYPSPNSFSRTFQVPVNSEKISRFQETWEPWIWHTESHFMHINPTVLMYQLDVLLWCLHSSENKVHCICRSAVLMGCVG